MMIDFSLSPQEIEQKIESEEYRKKLIQWENARGRMIQEKTKNIPKKGGVYCLYFPNGMKFWGSSINLRERVREHLYCLFPNPQLDFTKLSGQWYEKCRRQMPNITGYDIEIKYQICEDYKQRGQEKLRDIAADKGLKSQFFNSRFV